MKKLSKKELKNIKGGSNAPASDDCPLNQAACVFAGHSGKAKSTGSGPYDWKCCK